MSARRGLLARSQVLSLLGLGRDPSGLPSRGLALSLALHTLLLYARGRRLLGLAPLARLVHAPPLLRGVTKRRADGAQQVLAARRHGAEREPVRRVCVQMLFVLLRGRVGLKAQAREVDVAVLQ